MVDGIIAVIGGAACISLAMWVGFLVNRPARAPKRTPPTKKKPGYRVYWKDATHEFTLGVYADPAEAKSVAKAYASIIRPGESPENSDIHICYDQDSPPFYFHREYPENEFL